MGKRKLRKEKRTCYMCNKIATSREHVPPICIFPESKDLPPSVDYRKNLIKVPSCPEHNLRKSRDDEYLLFLLVTNWAVNNAGLRQWKTKILRSINYRPSKYGIFRNLTPVFIKGVQTGAYSIDFKRIKNEVEKICRGIYYHNFHKQWLYPIEVVIPGAIAIGSPEARHNNSLVRETTILISKFLETEPVHGENPEIFYYSFKVDAETLSYVLRMVFYGGLEVSTLSTPTQSAPSKTT